MQSKTMSLVEDENALLVRWVSFLKLWRNTPRLTNAGPGIFLYLLLYILIDFFYFAINYSYVSAFVFYKIVVSKEFLVWFQFQVAHLVRQNAMLLVD